MKTWIFVAATVVFSLALVGSEFGKDETITIANTTTLEAEGLLLTGRISTPFTPRGDSEAGQDCLGGREVEASIKDARDYRMVGRDLTSAEGAWSLPVREFDARYRVTIQSAEFAYAPGYGRLATVHCLPATISGRLTRRGFHADEVLGQRFSRGSSNASGSGSDGPLPLSATDFSMTSYLAATLALLALGLAMTRARRVFRTTSRRDGNVSHAG